MTPKSFRGSFELEIPVTIDGCACIVTAQASGYYEPGCLTGPLDGSYPADSECELHNILVAPDDGESRSIDFFQLSKKIQTDIETRLTERFFQRLEADAWEVD